MTATYTKLRDGSWGVRITSTATAGAPVRIQKRDGTTCDQTIDRVIWSDGKTSIATISASARSDSSSHRSSYSRGIRAPGGRRCDYCGGRQCPRAWDPRALCEED